MKDLLRIADLSADDLRHLLHPGGAARHNPYSHSHGTTVDLVIVWTLLAGAAVLVGLTRGRLGLDLHAPAPSVTSVSAPHRLEPRVGLAGGRPEGANDSENRRHSDCPPADDMCPASVGRSVGSPR
jgi:hypothetical protein